MSADDGTFNGELLEADYDSVVNTKTVFVIALAVVLVAACVVVAVLGVTATTNARTRDIGVACVDHGGRWINDQCIR